MAGDKEEARQAERGCFALKEWYSGTGSPTHSAASTAGEILPGVEHHQITPAHCGACSSLTALHGTSCWKQTSWPRAKLSAMRVTRQRGADRFCPPSPHHRGSASGPPLAPSSRASVLHSAHSLTPQCPREKLVKGWPSAASAVEPVVSLHLL